ncbi:amidohydrolase [Parashewanella curva]|uniref:Amidohydrolase n=1 Tax=Parashewanella curva TaxID=2338552 RepID=A0A3L8PWA3_9GAMM|nr:amidohydrolase family protein [Parashewanella curva]RLV58718.1 amidohydrolase [Parashewanella curva]
MININKVISASALVVMSSSSFASVLTPNANNKLTALTHANIFVAPGKVVKNATLLVENDRVKAIIEDNDIPQAALEIDLSGYTIYPGFIDPYTQYGIDYSFPETKQTKPIYFNDRIGGNASNDAIHAEKEWFSYIKPDAKSAKTWINNGFTSVQSAKLDGIFRGRGVSLSLENDIPNKVIYQARSHQFMSFNKGSSKQDYPGSLMGSIALIRQTLSDAKWYKENYNKPGTLSQPNEIEFNAAYEKLGNLHKQHIIFETTSLNNQLRAARELAEFDLTPTIVGTGNEYSRINEIKALNYSIILPLKFPDAPNVADSDSAKDVKLAELRHWERASSNPAALAKADISFAFTLSGSNQKEFWKALRKAVNAGLSKQDALAALTTNPAEMANISDIAGKLEPGYKADFVISKGDLFDNGKIYSVWLQGNETQIHDRSLDNLAGNYQLTLNQIDFDLGLEKGTKLDASLSSGEQQIELDKVKYDNERLTFIADLSGADYQGVTRFVLWLDGKELTGRMETADGTEYPVTAKRIKLDTDSENLTSKNSQDSDKKTSFVSKTTHPNVAFGFDALPEQETVLIKNATVWTSEKSGILKNTDVLIKNGEIDEIGQGLKAPRKAIVIDATGKHLTAGIVDEHSHIAINGGVNEATHAVTSEVRIGDVLNPDDVNIYRALAGGVTTVQLLHGSANPIGGQAQTIKLRWGDTAEELKFKEANPSIKFALGENVKQTHWGEKFSRRFPKSRMGVDALFRETMDSALEYEQAKKDYDDLRRSSKRKIVAPRKDYRLEAVNQVINGERDVHIHSYVASEILMFLKVADAYGFTVKAFTHILEGYKVADEMAKHGTSASTFSDWWAYKFEVYDAIPQNTCLMTEKGVLTSVNSDDREMMRRLNQEAAKSMFYCDMSEIDAWNMVTINPAKQLGVDKYVGSIKQGKQADLALWSHNPLSVYAKAEKVWVDGKRYFDIEIDKQKQQQVATERQALIQKILTSGTKMKQKSEAPIFKEPEWHCDTLFHAWDKSHNHSH